jgi:hypothetical protein
MSSDFKENLNIIIANRIFENVAEYKYLWTTVTIPNLFRGEVKRRLN